MLFPLSDPGGSDLLSSTYPSIVSQFQGELAERLSVEQMFVLIDGVLPFEACLYYQVLPLFIEGSRLHLGMVSPDDSGASDYVRRIVSYHNYSLISRKISNEALQTALSAYLNYSGQRQKSQPPTASKGRMQRSSTRSRAEQQIDRNIQETLVVDSPDELNGDRFASADASTSLHASTQMPWEKSAAQAAASIAEPTEPTVQPVEPTVDPGVKQADPVIDEPAVDVAMVTPLPVENHPAPPHPPVIEEPKHTPRALHPPSPLPSMANPPTLHLSAKHLSSPVGALQALPPNELVQELLARVLVSGIGRLYFERQSQYGRIVWSQNGELRSVIDRLELPVFQGVINALKHLTGLSLVPLQAPKQTEIERMYQNSRLLLRFRFMPNEHGEEATLQVLRGAALKFYQQQQLSKLERDALLIARQLQNKVNEIRNRAQAETGAAYSKSEILPSLSQLLQNIEEQIGSIQSHPEDDEVSG